MLIFFHSLVRWLVLGSLGFALFRAYRGYFKQLPFTRLDNAVRHWTATTAHIQMMIGIVVFVQSPVAGYLWKDFSEGRKSPDVLFFGLIHVTLMLTAIVLISIGTALAKRNKTDEAKFRAMLVWFTIGLIIILLAIPWPFSPLASRPLWRGL